jgi:uncharacterized protein YjdB
MKKTLSTLLSLIMIFVFTTSCMASNTFDQSNGKHNGIVKKEQKQEYKEKVNDNAQIEESSQPEHADKTFKADKTKTGAEDISSTDDEDIANDDEDANNDEVIANDDEDANNTDINNVPAWAKGYVKKDIKKNAKLGFFNRFHSKVQVAKAETVVIIAKAAGLEPVDVSDMNFDNILISKDDAGYIKALWVEKISFTRAGITALIERIVSNDKENTDDADTDNTIKSVTLPETATMEQGESITLNVTVEYADETTDNNVTWSSSDTDIATVDENGKVTAAVDAEGPVTITATATQDGVTKSATCEVTVENSDSTSD